MEEGLSETYVFWDANSYIVDLKKPKSIENFQLKQELSEKPSRASKGLVDIKNYKKLIDIKDSISTIHNWKKWSKFVNPYDKISTLSSNNYGKDYYKLYEILKFYNLKGSAEIDVYLCMCDAPGLFARCLKYFNPKAEGYVTSFYTHGAPEFEDFIDEKQIISKEDLTDYDTIEGLYEFLPKCDIITADGSVDTTHDPKNQEQLNLHLIYSEILTALMCQSVGGTFILKIFDIFTRPTAQLIYLLTLFYENVSILKPRTSKFTNSEKFVVARKFKGVENADKVENADAIENATIIEQMQEISKNWDSEFYCRTFGIDIPESVEKQLKEFNNKMIDLQTSHIEQAIKWSCNEDDVPEKQIEAYQNRKAIDLCSTFGINTNLSAGSTLICKHFKKTKVNLDSKLKNVMVCEKCLMLLV